MEEVDKIILDSLKNIDCDIGDIMSLKEFNSDLFVLAISCCLEAILPDVHLPKKLPPSMSTRLKIVSVLSDHIQKLGFHGDMGYSTILYGSELETRRILMFLIERLPRDTSKTTAVVQTGYVPELLKELDENLQLYFKHMWIPSSLLYNGIREHEGSSYSVHSFGNGAPLISESLIISDFSSQGEDLLEYLNYVVPEVTKQCSATNIVPSMLFQDCCFPDTFNLVDFVEEPGQHIEQLENQNHIENFLKINASTITSDNSQNENIEIQHEVEMDKMSCELNDMKQKYVALKQAVTDIQLDLTKTENMQTEEELLLNDTLSKVKLKTKTLAVMSKEDNIVKLQNLIQNANDRFVELTLQWEQIKTPLLEEYKSLQKTMSIEETQYQKQQNKLIKLEETYNKLCKDLNEKNILEDALTHKCQQLSKTDKRSGYTRRIYEIIGNINKQNFEIQRILKDTRSLQKDIKNLTEKIDRSFTLADELIFHDAKQEEMARKGYKLLAALRDEFNIILKAVSDVGQIERECRNLQEQMDTEKSKETGAKLNKVNADLLQIQKETESLENNL